MRFSRLTRFNPKVSNNEPQPRKPITRANILLDHIKRKVVEAAKAPDRKRQQQADPPTRTLKNQQQRRHDPDSQEQQALALDPKWIREVFHACNAPSQRPAFRNSDFG